MGSLDLHTFKYQPLLHNSSVTAAKTMYAMHQAGEVTPCHDFVLFFLADVKVFPSIVVPTDNDGPINAVLPYS
jgi:hypothetical protein